MVCFSSPNVAQGEVSRCLVLRYVPDYLGAPKFQPPFTFSRHALLLPPASQHRLLYRELPTEYRESGTSAGSNYHQLPQGMVTFFSQCYVSIMSVLSIRMQGVPVIS